MSGAWFASTPIEPVVVRVETISTSSSKTFPSGVRTSTGKLLLAIAFPLLGALLAPRPAGGLDDVVDRALQQEGAFGDVVVPALDDLPEGAHRLLDRDVGARRAGELLRHEERLREEALDLARPLHRELVLVRELL